LIGTYLDKYEVLQKIGEGGMATVYRGRHGTLDREVAIKVLHPHLSSSQRNRKRFAREARTIEQLRHDNILEIFDYSGSDASDCYIITEFVKGETLTALLNRAGPLPSEVCSLIGANLSRALAYAHHSSVLHRDLKPDNVMVRDDGTVKLMDFGIARFLDESHVTMTGALVGSPAFMSPEQAREGNLDARSDLFSLGTLLFYLVSGHLPFAGSNPSLILKNIIEGNRPAVSELVPTMSASLSDVIERLLQPDREERFNSAAEVITALEASLAETNVDPRAPHWSLTAFVVDPEAYSRRLEEHLSTELLERGKAYLADGEHLLALRLFNRLLCIDEDQSEVLALVQGLHEEAAEPERSRPILGAGLLLAVAAAAALLWAVGSLGPPQVEVVDVPGPTDQPEAPIEMPLQSPVDEPETSLPTEPSPAVFEPIRAVPPPVRGRPALIRPLKPEPVAEPTTDQGTDVDAAPANLPALLELRVRPPFWADIYEGGRVLGSTRDREPIELAPGPHVVILKSTLMQDKEMLLQLEAGQHFVRKDIVLQPKPVLVRIDADFEDSCTVNRDGEQLGTLADLSHRVSLPTPDHEHMLVIQCGERIYTRTFANLIDPVVEFKKGG